MVAFHCELCTDPNTGMGLVLAQVFLHIRGAGREMLLSARITATVVCAFFGLGLL